MNFNLKKSFVILANNPHITLLLVTYLLIFAGLIPLAVIQPQQSAFLFIMGLLLIFSGAFLAGWFGMIKCVVQYKEKGDLEEDLKYRYSSFKNGFFSSIPVFMPSIIFFILLFIAVNNGLNYVANHIFGDPREIMMQILPYANSKDALVNFISTLPTETKISIAERSLFVLSGIIFYLLLTFYAIPSLFFGGSSNPFVAIKNGVLNLFKKPLFTFSLLMLIIFSHVLIIFIEAISSVNQISMFLALVLRVCFIAYVVVLIFSVYETNFTDNCNNGGNRLGENKLSN